MGKVLSINISPTRGIEKTSIAQVEVTEGWGLEGDAHGGDWDRQVSIFPVEAIDKVPPEKKEEVMNNGFTENFTIQGIEQSMLTVGSYVVIGESIIRVLHIGKEKFKEHGRPYIVSREGRFGRVVKGGRVKIGDNVSVIDWSKDSFLQWVREGNYEMVRFFLVTGMNPDVKDNYDATALMLAAKHGHVQVARLLLDKGADVNAQSVDLVTALMVAAYAGYADIVEMFLTAGADCNMCSSSGLTALKLARAGNHSAVIRLLEQASPA